MRPLIIYCDGASRGNPGPSSAAAVVYDKRRKLLKEATRYLGVRTNNEAEYEAIILGLKTALELKSKDVRIKSDSELVIKQIKGSYEIKSSRLRPLLTQVRKLAGRFQVIHFEHLRIEWMGTADRLVRKVLKEEMGV